MIDFWKHGYMYGYRRTVYYIVKSYRKLSFVSSGKQ